VYDLSIEIQNPKLNCDFIAHITRRSQAALTGESHAKYKVRMECSEQMSVTGVVKTRIS
jgi:hypothetical protein